MGEEVHVYIFQKFGAKRKEIEGREDCFQITKDGGLLGDVSYSEFYLLCDFRSDENDLFPIQDGERRDSEDCESKDPCEFLPIDDLKDDTY